MRQTFATINLKEYRYNLALLQGFLGPSVRLMAVVKADAYGHGLVPMAKAAQAAGVSSLGVALVEEGIQLRKAGIQLPILVLASLQEEGTLLAVEQGLTLTVHSPKHIWDAQTAADQAGLVAKVHIKLDTGMGRIGARNEEEVLALLQALEGSPRVHLCGAFTHLACADVPGSAKTDEQIMRFNSLAGLLPKGLDLHACASASAISGVPARFNLCRIGIASYGYSPVPTDLPLHPVLSLMAEITHVKRVQPGDSISYGATFTAKEPMVVATLAIGYGDGYRRSYSGKASVLVNGRRCPVLGRVCMDQIMVDVSAAGPVHAGDLAVLIGRQGEEVILADELAGLSDTIPYEVLLALSSRVPRHYIEGTEHDQ